MPGENRSFILVFGLLLIVISVLGVRLPLKALPGMARDPRAVAFCTLKVWRWPTSTVTASGGMLVNAGHTS